MISYLYSGVMLCENCLVTIGILVKVKIILKTLQVLANKFLDFYHFLYVFLIIVRFIMGRLLCVV